MLLCKDIVTGRAKTQHVRERRGVKGSSSQRTTLSESDNEHRGLQDVLPCTHYYSSKKSKFHKYDDDWYTPCKTVESGYPTASPKTSTSESPSPSVLKTKQPSAFFSATSPVELSWTNSSIESNPPLTIVTGEIIPKPDKPIAGPTNVTGASPSYPIISPSNATVESEEASVEIKIDIDVPTKDKGISCLKAKAGHIFPTSVNFTIHYKYELLAEREANLTSEVWPEIDRAFQRFLSLTLIDCDIDVKSSGASPTFQSRLKSISPEPVDSVGSLYPNGWNSNISSDSNASSCSKILIDDALLAKRGLYCDVVTGSITLYLSELTYMDTASDPSILFLEYRDEVFKFLRNEINEGGEAISNYFDDSLGIRGFHFLSESANLNLRPILVPDAAFDEDNPFEPNNETSSTTVITGALTALGAFTIAAGVFAFHRRKKNLDQFEDTFKQNRTPRMDDNEMEFYDLENSNNGSTDEAAIDRSKAICREMFFLRQGDSVDDSQESADDIQTIPRSDFDAMYDLHERSSMHSRSSLHSASYDYSQVGVSMRLYSPDKNLSTHSRTERPDPSVAASNVFERKCSMDSSINEDSQGDKFPAPARLSIGSRSSSEASVSSSKYVDSVKGSPALEYILALSSTYLSSSDKPFDEETVTGNQNDVESLSAETSSVRESTNTQGAKFSPSPDIGKRDTNTTISPDISLSKRLDKKLDKRNSPNSVAAFSSVKTPPTLSSFDDGSSIQSPASTASESSSSSRVEYLRNRRKDLENRFQNYRRSLSESMDNLPNKSPPGSWLTSHEFCRSVSLYKNSDQSFSSPVVAASNESVDEGLKSTTSDSREEEGSLVDSNSPRIPDKQRARVRKNFEEILDNDNAWGIEPPEEDSEKQTVDNFLSSYSMKTTPESDRTRFQANTVIL